MAIKGVDEVKRKLKKLGEMKQVSFAELLHPDFMAGNTDFATYEEMFEQSGFKVQNAEDFAAIPDDEWDEFIQARTKFESWAEMQKVAFQQHLKRVLR